MSKPSTAQIDANRANAQLGHGPTTGHGKQISSRNALRHGLTGRVVVLPGEDMEVYKAFANEIIDSLHPESPMECQFAQTIADTQWRLNRARTFEDGMLVLGHLEERDFNADPSEIHAALTNAKVFREHSKDFVNLTLYEQRLGRSQKEAFRQLRELQAERKAAAPAASVPVNPIAAPSQEEKVSPVEVRTMAAGQAITPGLAATSEQIGFVYSDRDDDRAPETVMTFFAPVSTPLAEKKAA